MGQRENLGEVCGDEQHATPGCGGGANAGVNELDRADIDTTRGLRGEQHRELAAHLARDDDLLLVPAGERAGRQGRVRRPDVEFPYALVAVRRDRAPIEHTSLREVVLPSEDEVVGDGVVQDEPATMPIFRDVRQAGVSTLTHAEGGDVARPDTDAA